MSTRESFFARIRDRLREPMPENPLRPMEPSAVIESIIRYAVDLSDPGRQFIETTAGAGVEIVGSPDDELRAVIDRVCADVQPSRVVVSDDPECEMVEGILRSRDIEVLRGGDPVLVATADLGVTGAVSGVALTGSVVIDSGRARSRLASLLPEVHLVLLSHDRIVPTPGDLLRRIPDLSGGPPSSLVFITGPSRSADIELEITIGVHGPRRVLVALR